MAIVYTDANLIERYADGTPVSGATTPVPSVPVNAAYPIQPFIPGTLVAGADIQAFFLPSFFSGHALSRVSVWLDTPSTSGDVTFRLELYTGTSGTAAFTATQTSSTFPVPAGARQVDITSFAAGLTGNANDKVRVFIITAGTGAANMDIKTEWLKS